MQQLMTLVRHTAVSALHSEIFFSSLTEWKMSLALSLMFHELQSFRASFTPLLR
jgi:hypothetical protein